ncbi:MAG: hypothetical protein HY293_06360 [Planctomycetes bacterium]|nr:hypothetical protein [Planctomycetota bacterium]
MKGVALAVLLLLSQDPAPSGVAIERTVRRTTIDWLGRREEIQRKELLLVKGPNLAIIDLTFGERLIIRGDRKKITKADPLAREYAEFSFDEAAALRKAALDGVRAAKARVPGTPDEKELEAILEGFDQFATAPTVELKAEAAQREVIVNGDRVRASVQVNAKLQAPGWMEALAAAGAFHPSVAEKLRGLGGIPVKGTLRYALFLDRVVEQFDVTAAGPREVADAEFELPAGLVRAPLKGFEHPPERKFSRPANLKTSFKEDEGEKPKPEPEKKP